MGDERPGNALSAVGISSFFPKVSITASPIIGEANIGAAAVQCSRVFDHVFAEPFRYVPKRTVHLARSVCWRLPPAAFAAYFAAPRRARRGGPGEVGGKKEGKKFLGGGGNPHHP